jgi:hypothetical protein
MAALDARVVCVGHGDAINQDAADVIRRPLPSHDALERAHPMRPHGFRRARTGNGATPTRAAVALSPS